MKTFMAAIASVSAAFVVNAASLPVDKFLYAGPYALPGPVMIDNVDVNSKPYDAATALSRRISFDAAFRNARQINSQQLSSPSDHPALGLISFNFTNRSFITPEIKVEGIADYKVEIDGKEIDKPQGLRPGTHRAIVKFMQKPGENLKPDISLIADNTDDIEINADYQLYTLDDVLHGRRISSTSISPDGKYLITAYTEGLTDGKSLKEWQVTTIDGKPVARSNEKLEWMPIGASYYSTIKTPDGTFTIRQTDAATGASSVFADNVPVEEFRIAPNQQFIVLSETIEGPKEDKQVYRILEPEDRQPGWRDRQSLALFDIATGITRPITFGHKDVALLDISDDGRKILVRTSQSRLQSRPTTLFNIAIIDLATMKADTIVANDGFIGDAIFSPDGNSILLSGSPEALNGIGKNVPEGKIPSMVDHQLYLYDVSAQTFKPLTRDFNPSVEQMQWSRADGQIYFNAENRDCISLYTLNPTTGKIMMLPLDQDVVESFSVPANGSSIGVVTQSVENPHRLYAFNTRTSKPTLLDEPLAERLRNTRLGKVEAWDFVNSKGDTICGRFYLPPNFDASKKYPLIVNYYGGCSPTSRNFESRYPHHAYAAQGYVVYVVEPSGATGFGQEFSSRHVNTAGDGPAQDIIEGTKQFCKEHPYVDPSKIGCIGASYGGFMTQYLQTVTDIFAAAISHAGISDHSSYWGEGYWGYSYSEVSMANSYPWSHPDLYVKQSPLYNADKIHTPLLFLHGAADNNVPVGESIQMFTALKLLDRPTAFVAVADQDHHILDHDKRIKWQDTIFAWFAKYLKDEPQWWDKMYPEHSL